jgi:hypothetical protein
MLILHLLKSKVCRSSPINLLLPVEYYPFNSYKFQLNKANPFQQATAYVLSQKYVTIIY